jgi:uracil-DNA glycosylase family 4
MSGFFSQSKVTQDAPAPRIAKCGSCGLAKGACNPKMGIYGKGRKSILFVGGSPTKGDDLQGLPLGGKAGIKLKKALDFLGHSLKKDCWVTNALICHCPEPPDSTKLNACSANLMKTIKAKKPNVIVLLGEYPTLSLFSLLRKESVSSSAPYMGWCMPNQEVNAWIIPTYHPEEVISKPDGVKERLFRSDLKKAFRRAKAPPFGTVPDYSKDIQVITRPLEASKVLKAMTKHVAPIAFDYETTALKPEYEGAEIVSCSVCWGGKKTIAYPWSGEAIDATLDLLKAKHRKIACNMKFEHRWTKKICNTRVKNWVWDTMIAAHVLDNRPGITSLKFQAFALLGQGNYNRHIEPYLSSKKGEFTNSIHEIEIGDLLLYNGLDSLLEYKVAKKQMKKMGVEI